jgi:hypothetical protein
MKKLITPIIALAILITSCGDAAENKETEATPEDKTEEVKTNQEEDQTIGEAETENEELLNYEGTDEEDHRFDNLCSEKVVSDCYVVDYFVYMDAIYVTVDFVNYKVIETDSEPEYELVNEKSTLRTFLLNEEYLDCAHDKSVTVENLMKKVEADKFTLFNLEAEEGIVNEFFIRNCAG